MSSSPGRFALSSEEIGRIEHIDRLAAGGAASIPMVVEMLDDPSWTVRRAVVSALVAAGAPVAAALVETLRTGRDSEARIAAAVDALAAIPGADVVEGLLVAMAADPNPSVVADVAQILGRRRATSGLGTLVQLVRHPDDNVAVTAIEALGRVGGRAAVDSLVGAVRSGNFFRTFPAIDVLGRSGDPRAVAPLTALLDEAPYAAEAARALGRTADPAAVAPLAGRLRRGSDAGVRVAALALADLYQRHLDRFGRAETVEQAIRREAADPAVVRHLAQALAGGDPHEQAAICFVLGRLGDPSAGPALTALLDGAAPTAREAAEALKRLGPAADAQVVEGLVAGDSARRRALLPLVSRPSLAREVLACLGDPDPDVRALACEALGRIGATGSVGKLFPLLGDANPRVAFAALAAIQALGGRETQALSTEAARASDPRVRRAAMRILGYFGFPGAVDILLRGLDDPDARVRESAIQGLPFVEERRALEGLLSAARSPSARTRGVAMRALGQCMGDLRVTAYLLKGLDDQDAWVRYYACQALGKLGFEPAVDRIIRLLGDPAGHVRVAAVEALSCLDSDRARGALTSAVTDAEADIQRAAIVGLGVAGKRESLPIILGAASAPDPATRLVALAALAGFDAPEVLRALERAAADPDESVRTAAIGFLAAAPGPAATAALASLLESTPVPEQIVGALSVNVDGRIPGLVAALGSADDETAAALTSALARLRHPDGAAALAQVMSRPNVAARKAAANALAALSTGEALDVLKSASLDDPDPEVRQICALLLAR